MNRVKISVVIPTYRDGEQLRHCLTALENQSLPRKSYEILVINNDPSDDISEVTAAFPEITVLSESQPGSYAARNCGIAAAKGEVIAFTDSDCIPAQSWLELGVRRLTQTVNCGLVAGRIELFYQNPANPSSSELYDMLFEFDQKHFLEHDHYGATANVFTYRDVLEHVGLFSTELQSGGDFQWGQRVYRAGYQMVYGHEVVIRHPTRSQLRELTKKARRVIEGHFVLASNGEKLQNNHFTKKRFLLGIFADFLLPFRSFPYILSTQILKSHHQRLKAIQICLLMRYMKAWFRLQYVSRLIRVGTFSKG